MTGWLVPAQLAAAVVMVLLVLVPHRLRLVQLGAVLGWAVVWQDNRLTGHWVDPAGVAVVMTCVVVWLSAARRPAPRTRERGTRR